MAKASKKKAAKKAAPKKAVKKSSKQAAPKKAVKKAAKKAAPKKAAAKKAAPKKAAKKQRQRICPLLKKLHLLLHQNNYHCIKVLKEAAEIFSSFCFCFSYTRQNLTPASTLNAK